MSHLRPLARRKARFSSREGGAEFSVRNAGGLGILGEEAHRELREMEVNGRVRERGWSTGASQTPLTALRVPW